LFLDVFHGPVPGDVVDQAQCGTEADSEQKAATYRAGRVGKPVQWFRRIQDGLP
jgi:hypothetical protein